MFRRQIQEQDCVVLGKIREKKPLEGARPRARTDMTYHMEEGPCLALGVLGAALGLLNGMQQEKKHDTDGACLVIQAAHSLPHGRYRDPSCRSRCYLE